MVTKFVIPYNDIHLQIYTSKYNQNIQLAHQVHVSNAYLHQQT